MDILLSLFIPLVVWFVVFRIWPLLPIFSRDIMRVRAWPWYHTLSSFTSAHFTRLSLPQIFSLESSFNALSRQQKRILTDAGYDDKLRRGRECVSANARVVGEVGDIVRQQLGSSVGAWGDGSKDDISQLREVLRHYVRDWSAEGAKERATIFRPILGVLKLLQEGRGESTKQPHILVPGAGLARLAYEVARLEEWDVTAVERSPYMNIARRALLPSSPAVLPLELNQFKIHPFSWWWSHQRSSTNLFRAVSFPDIVPESPNLRIIEGDFLELSPQSALRTETPSPPASVLDVALPRKRDIGYDFVVTLFFIDALPNPVRTLTHIYSLLASGGVWINLGPLLYGTGGQDRVELCLDEVLAVAESLGFEFDDMRQYGFQDEREEREQGRQKTSTIKCEYTCDDRAMMRWVYGAEMWVARKV
ncbi:N2227-domain-containing protein [Hymenopellis radicata]|nr:N2227-domain-containing protein [Hymenopellis radicata]